MNYKSNSLPYNFARTAVDHRRHQDFNYAINSPTFSKTWLKSLKNRFVAGGMAMSGMYYAGSTLMIVSVVAYLDAYYRSLFMPAHQ